MRRGLPFSGIYVTITHTKNNLGIFILFAKLFIGEKEKKKERTRVIQLTTYCMFAQIEKLSKLKILRGGSWRRREGGRERGRERGKEKGIERETDF